MSTTFYISFSDHSLCFGKFVEKGQDQHQQPISDPSIRVRKSLYARALSCSTEVSKTIELIKKTVRAVLAVRFEAKKVQNHDAISCAFRQKVNKSAPLTLRSPPDSYPDPT